MRNYGNSMKEIRKSNGLSLKDVEEKTGISNQNISRWEQNKVMPSIEHCEKLADFYGITIDELIGREKPYTENGIKNFTNTGIIGKNNKGNVINFNSDK